jgi:hypothetical protein
VTQGPQDQTLNLRAGEWVEVRGAAEIMATLNERGCLENLPFMPEMLLYCGHKLRVSKRSDKTCDNIQQWSIRRMVNTVHLEGVRCNGDEHGGCQAGCLIFWKEAWLKRPSASAEMPGPVPSSIIAKLQGTTRHTNAEGETIYSCQATKVLEFSSYMPWWDPRQYVRDITSGNLDSGISTGSKSERVLEFMLSLIAVIRSFLISFFTEFRRLKYPSTRGTLTSTPFEALNLQPGELVQVRSKEEIMATLDKDARNRGLLFDGEMLPYCGNVYRVHGRVHHIIDEKTGKMMNMKNPCIVLEGVVCKSDYHRFCPRAIYSYWRENWLQRVPLNPVSSSQQEREVETLQRS